MFSIFMTDPQVTLDVVQHQIEFLIELETTYSALNEYSGITSSPPSSSLAESSTQRGDVSLPH